VVLWVYGTFYLGKVLFLSDSRNSA